jgi:hypothetical protein
MQEAIDKKITLRVKVIRTRAINEYILCYIDMFAVAFITGEVTITLKPGDELRIDSGNYTAFLNTIYNVIESYSGEWIFITPLTLEIIITTGNNRPIVGEIIYLERFI